MMKGNDMISQETQQNLDCVGRMIHGLQSVGKDYALGYLESFIVQLIRDHVSDPLEQEKLRLRMLMIGIDALLDAKK
jgi:hypothetical protein